MSSLATACFFSRAGNSRLMPGRLALHLAYQGAYSIDLMPGHGLSAAKKKVGWWGGRSQFSPAREGVRGEIRQDFVLGDV